MQSGSNVVDTNWIALQLADSALPSGGFAHSGGLEACYRLGNVRTHDELENHLAAQMIQWARGVGPIGLMAFRDTDNFTQADALCDLFLNHPVSNRASRAQGRGFLFAATHAFGAEKFSLLKDHLAADSAAGHFAPIFGAVCRLLNLDETAAVRLFLFTYLRGLITAAVRLGIIGPIAAGSMQYRLLGKSDRPIAIALQTDPQDAAQTAPFAELFAANHDRLYSRLFQS